MNKLIFIDFAKINQHKIKNGDEIIVLFNLIKSNSIHFKNASRGIKALNRHYKIASSSNHNSKPRDKNTLIQEYGSECSDTLQLRKWCKSNKDYKQIIAEFQLENITEENRLHFNVEEQEDDDIYEYNLDLNEINSNDMDELTTQLGQSFNQTWENLQQEVNDDNNEQNPENNEENNDKNEQDDNNKKPQNSREGQLEKYTENIKLLITKLKSLVETKTTSTTTEFKSSNYISTNINTT